MIKLNIGLLVERTGQVWTVNQVLAFVRIHFSIQYYRLEEGEYNGVKQLTLAMVVEPFGAPRTKVIENIQALCLYTEQTCIAAVFKEGGVLIYHPRHNGEKQAFDKQYFIEPYKQA